MLDSPVMLVPTGIRPRLRIKVRIDINRSYHFVLLAIGGNPAKLLQNE